jgi:signal transduction histidine kinase
MNFKPYKSYIFLGLSVIFTVVIAYIIFIEIQGLFKYSLQEKVKAIASTAALQFNAEELDQIKGPESVETEIYRKTVLQLQEIRIQNPTLRFVDIFKRTDEAHLFAYVADADSMHPEIPIDLNADGIIDEEDALNYPGDIYDGTDVPNFVENAFIKPDVDSELEWSQWGFTLDASAPIFYENGTSDYVFNISVDVSEFIRQSEIAFIPYAILVFIFVVLLTMLTLSLVRMWRSRVEFFQEQDRQKNELLSMVSHQLATPITSVKWYIEMMTTGDLGKITKEQKDHLQSVLSISSDLTDLVSMILDVSRIQLGKIKIEKKKLELNVFFEEILEVINPKAKQKKVQFNVKMPKELPEAMLDKRYTRMTIENLLTNAVKYTPEGGDVNFTVTLKGKNTLYCEVRDTGCGIPLNEQDKIFGKMFRASNVRNSIDGNGFGLYVAKGAIDAQGGKIWFKSEEGKGTTFYVELPLK